VLILVFLFLMVTPAFAIDPSSMRSIIDYCETTKDFPRCVRPFLQAQSTPAEAPSGRRESAPSNADLLLLFSLPSFTPYSLPPVHALPLPPATLLAPPVNCQTSAIGGSFNTLCY
jgi:hypothetical protein